jgi:hypothetical protein
MPVIVRLSPLLRKYVRGYEHTTGIQIDQAGVSVSQLIKDLSIPKEMVTSVLVNHRPSRTGYVVKDGDHVFLAMVIGGG